MRIVQSATLQIGDWYCYEAERIMNAHKVRTSDDILEFKIDAILNGDKESAIPKQVWLIDEKAIVDLLELRR